MSPISMTKKKKYIGVEIGTDTAKIAVYGSGGIEKLAYGRLPENLVREGRVTAPAAMSEFLKQMMKDNGIRPGDCGFVIPTQLVIAHHVSVPVMGENELKINLPFEFRDFVGKDSEKYDYDYSVVRVADNRMELYAAAVPKSAVDSYYDILKKAGLTMKVAIPHEMAWLNLIGKSKSVPECLCVVDVGMHTTQVDIFAGGNFVMGKAIEIGGALIDDAIASAQTVDPYVARTRKEANFGNVLELPACTDAYNAIAVEVIKVVAYYNYSCENENEKLKDIYFCGGSCAIAGLRDAIEKGTSLNIHSICKLAGLDNEEDILPLYCAIAAGAAAQL